jgi:hypothetical protein
VAQNNGLERTSAVYGKRASVRSPLNPVFCGRGIKWMSKTAEEGARFFRVVRE